MHYIIACKCYIGLLILFVNLTVCHTRVFVLKELKCIKLIMCYVCSFLTTHMDVKI